MEHINPRHAKVKVETHYQMVKEKHMEAPHTEIAAYIKSACMSRHALVTRGIQLVVAFNSQWQLNSL